MTQYVRGHDMGVEICRALGIEYEHVRSVTIRASVGEVVTATVEYLALEGQVKGAIAVFRAQKWVRQEGEASE